MIITKALFGTGVDGIDLVDHKHDLDGRDGLKMDLNFVTKGLHPKILMTKVVTHSLAMKH